jgi:hypothetical protein
MSKDTPASQVFRLLAAQEGIKVGSGGDLYSGELVWRDLQPWLRERGYLLRSRYAPDWVPSWKGTRKEWSSCEDGHRPKVRPLLWLNGIPALTLEHSVCLEKPSHGCNKNI